MLWLWCLASFIVGLTVGAGLIVLILLGGTPLQQRPRDDR